MGIEITTAKDTVQQRHAQTIHLTAVHEYTTVACCYHVEGERVILGVAKKQRHGDL